MKLLDNRYIMVGASYALVYIIWYIYLDSKYFVNPYLFICFATVGTVLGVVADDKKFIWRILLVTWVMSISVWMDFVVKQA